MTYVMPQQFDPAPPPTHMPPSLLLDNDDLNVLHSLGIRVDEAQSRIGEIINFAKSLTFRENAKRSKVTELIGKLNGR